MNGSPKILQTLFLKKAMSLMGNKRIKLLDHPRACKNGTIIGMENRYLDVRMDNGTQRRLAIGGYLHSFQYKDGVVTTLSEAGQATLKAHTIQLDHLKTLDVVKKDHEFKVGELINPEYVAWEMIKSADHVSVLHRCNIDGTVFLIEAHTSRGVFRAQADLEYLTTNQSFSFDRLPYSPQVAISMTQELFDHVKNTSSLNRIFSDLDESESDGHYLIGAIARHLAGRTDALEHCHYLDFNGEWTVDPNDAIAVPSSFNYQNLRHHNPYSLWKDLLSGLPKEDHELCLVPAQSLINTEELLLAFN